MNIQKTDKEVLTKEDILNNIETYIRVEVPTLDNLWAYYTGHNVSILKRKKVDANNPDNKIVVSYGRKIVNTCVGYGARPRYISLRPNTEQDASLENDSDASAETIKESLTKEEAYVKELQKTYNLNNEHIKTSRGFRNSCIFGMSYEVLYIDGMIDTESTSVKAEPKFFVADPREIILLYDYSPEPKPKMGIRFYRITDDTKKVEVYYADRVEFYTMTRSSNDMSQWILTPDIIKPMAVNFYGAVPIVPYYFGDEMMGVIRTVLGLIDALDVLYSDSMNEFDRFAFAYLIMKKFGLTDPVKMKTPGVFSNALANLKRSRIFEHVPADADIKFLTKDIPTGFIQFMKDALREQIHVQSHVPDFTSDKMAGASGRAIKRLLFDFENLISSTDADFDVGLIERIRLITIVYARTGKPIGTPDDFTIVHKRNLPDDTLENAQVANQLKTAGMSSYLVTSALGSELCPDVQAELMRQQKEAEELLEMNPLGTDMGLGEEITTEENITGEA